MLQPQRAGGRLRGLLSGGTAATAGKCLVIIDEVDDLAVFGESLVIACRSSSFRPLLLQGNFGIVGAVGHGRFDGFV